MNSNPIQSIKALAASWADEFVSIRRYLHQHPELSFEEYNTSQYIQTLLTKWGVQYTTGWCGTGIVATIAGRSSDRTIALRADMDALPIQEESIQPYVSKIPNAMHACGHDVHMTCLLGAIRILKEVQDQLPYDVRCIFQPGEEKLPGGASKLIEEGVLRNPVPIHIIGQHVFPDLPAGKVGIRSGMYMASADEIYITVKGKGGHGAMPHLTQDTVLAASQIIVQLQQIISRHANPTIPSVLSFGKIETIGGATNIIPKEVKLEGTFRTMNEEWRATAHTLIQHHVEAICRSMSVEVEINILKGYPCLVNDEEVSHAVKQLMIEFLGPDNVVDLPIRMTSEDFAFYTQEIPGCFYRLGTQSMAEGIVSQVHTPRFDVDEKSIPLGVGLMAYLALSS